MIKFSSKLDSDLNDWYRQFSKLQELLLKARNLLNESIKLMKDSSIKGSFSKSIIDNKKMPLYKTLSNYIDICYDKIDEVRKQPDKQKISKLDTEINSILRQCKDFRDSCKKLK